MYACGQILNSNNIMKEFKKNQFGAIVTSNATQSGLNFFYEIEHSEMLMIMFHIGSLYIENNKEDAKQFLIEIFTDEENEIAKQLVRNFKNSNVDHLFDIRTYEKFYGQMAYSRTIDNMLIYFKEILAEVIIKKPQILKSNETERLDFILNYENINELRIALSEKKIEHLFYAGIEKIEDFFYTRLGISIFKDKNDKHDFNQAIKNRNIIVHNRGRINTEYLREFPKSGYKLGESLKFTYEDISKINVIIGNYITILDQEIGNKFKLEFKKSQ